MFYLATVLQIGPVRSCVFQLRKFSSNSTLMSKFTCTEEDRTIGLNFDLKIAFARICHFKKD